MLSFKSLGLSSFNYFVLAYAHQDYIYLIKNTVKVVIFLNNITFNLRFLLCVLKCNLFL